MRVVRFDDSGTQRWGLLHDDETIRVLAGAPWDGGEPTGARLALRDVRLLAAATPSKIVCIGRNYAAHAAELGNQVPKAPLIFLKPPSAIVGPEAPIVLPAASQNVQHEAELALVIGRRARDLSEEEAAAAVFGHTCLNDVTARDIQREEVQFTRAKSFDTFCPVGPWIVPGLPAGEVAVRCRVNGQVRQEGSTGQMIHPFASLVAFISRVMTLEPGDLISTGTPAGVGRIEAGDRVEIEIGGVGVLANPVQAAG